MKFSKDDTFMIRLFSYWIIIVLFIGALVAMSIISTYYFHFTRYAPGFSPEAFSKVKLGMSRAEVKKLIGEPLSTFHGESYTTLNEKGKISTRGPVVTVDDYSKQKISPFNFYYAYVVYGKSDRVTYITVKSDGNGVIYLEDGVSHVSRPKYWHLMR